MDEARGLSSFSSVGYLGPNWNRTGTERGSKKSGKKKKTSSSFSVFNPRFFAFVFSLSHALVLCKGACEDCCDVLYLILI